MLTPEQESYREEIANRFGAAHVIPLPGHSSVAICGWVGSPETGWRADGAEWEWLHADGRHGPVDLSQVDLHIRRARRSLAQTECARVMAEHAAEDAKR